MSFFLQFFPSPWRRVPAISGIPPKMFVGVASDWPCSHSALLFAFHLLASLHLFLLHFFTSKNTDSDRPETCLVLLPEFLSYIQRHSSQTATKIQFYSRTDHTHVMYIQKSRHGKTFLKCDFKLLF